MVIVIVIGAIIVIVKGTIIVVVLVISSCFFRLIGRLLGGFWADVGYLSTNLFGNHLETS